jgi:hypothetical protein
MAGEPSAWHNQSRIEKQPKGWWHTTEVKVRLRHKNQMTLPTPIAKWLGVQPGDQLILRIDETIPTTVRLRPLLRSYAGIARGLFGTPDEAAEYIRTERASWDG